MPTISMFYGLIIRMLFMGTQRHHLPYWHVEYQGAEAVVTIPDGELIEGELPLKKLRLLQANTIIQYNNRGQTTVFAVFGQLP